MTVAWCGTAAIEPLVSLFAWRVRMRVAIIGSGPAGFYAAEALLKRTDVRADVDMFDRLPTPYGLVRGGVAPDHPKIKAVARVFATTAARPTFRFLGNVLLGRDVTVDDLRRHYHQIVYATGNEADRRLGIPGEGIWRCTPASAASSLLGILSTRLRRWP